MGLLSRRRGTRGMSNLIVGVHGGDGGVGGLGVREGPLTTGARRMWNTPLLKPLGGRREQALHGGSRKQRMSLLRKLRRSQHFICQVKYLRILVWIGANNSWEPDPFLVYILARHEGSA